jgi:uncharacterized damage-inducible protein DinB
MPFSEGMLRTLYDYPGWAMEKLFAAAAPLTVEQLQAPAPAGQRSIRDNFLHLIGTQRGWLAWWDGTLAPAQAYGRRLDPADFPDLATIRAAWEAVDRQTRAFLAGLTEADAERVYVQTLPSGAEWKMPLWQMLLHVANHGTQHRSEIAAQLSALGHSPGDLDLIYYLAPV